MNGGGTSWAVSGMRPSLSASQTTTTLSDTASRIALTGTVVKARRLGHADNPPCVQVENEVEIARFKAAVQGTFDNVPREREMAMISPYEMVPYVILAPTAVCPRKRRQ